MAPLSFEVEQDRFIITALHILTAIICSWQTMILSRVKLNVTI